MLEGLRLTFRHLFYATRRRKPLSVESPNYFDQQNGLVTTLYPHETIPVPDNGRYRLYNEIDDCIVCDLCAKICPVNCIEIDAIKSAEEIGKTSDGSAKRLYAGKFDIDMAKCCFCGLCTTVCPTECLTMTKTYDFPEFDILNMNYHFTNLSPEEAEEKRNLYEESQRIKAELKKQKEQNKGEENPPEQSVAPKVAGAKPAFKPAIKPVSKPVQQSGTADAGSENTEPNVPGQKTPDVPPTAKSAIKPIVGPITGTKKPDTPADKPTADSDEGNKAQGEAKKPAIANEEKTTPRSNVTKPIIRPVIKSAASQSETKTNERSDQPVENNTESPDTKPAKPVLPKPVIKPVVRPVIPEKTKEDTPADDALSSASASSKESTDKSDEEQAAKKAIRADKTTEDNPASARDQEGSDEIKNINPKPVRPVIKPIIKPVIKPKKDSEDSSE